MIYPIESHGHADKDHDIPSAIRSLTDRAHLDRDLIIINHLSLVRISNHEHTSALSYPGSPRTDIFVSITRMRIDTRHLWEIEVVLSIGQSLLSSPGAWISQCSYLCVTRISMLVCVSQSAYLYRPGYDRPRNYLRGELRTPISTILLPQSGFSPRSIFSVGDPAPRVLAGTPESPDLRQGFWTEIVRRIILPAPGAGRIIRSYLDHFTRPVKDLLR